MTIGLGYGLALIVDRGYRRRALVFRLLARPLHVPALAPTQGMPSIVGICGSPGMVPNGEFGTNIGVQTVVYTSISSPGVHAATGGAKVPTVGTANSEITGAATTATANPPARMSRRAGSWKVAIVTLSVVLLTVSSVTRASPSPHLLPAMSVPKLWRERSSAVATYSSRRKNVVPSQPEHVRAPFL